jgi:hypothetical protein
MKELTLEEKKALYLLLKKRKKVFYLLMKLEEEEKGHVLYMIDEMLKFLNDRKEQV